MKSTDSKKFLIIFNRYFGIPACPARISSNCAFRSLMVLFNFQLWSIEYQRNWCKYFGIPAFPARISSNCTFRSLMVILSWNLEKFSMLFIHFLFNFQLWSIDYQRNWCKYFGIPTCPARISSNCAFRSLIVVV